MRTTARNPISATIIALIVLAAGGCQAGARSTATNAPDSPATAASIGPSDGALGTARPTAAATTGAPAPVASADRLQAWLLVGRRADPGLRLVLSSTGEVGLDLPSGAPRTNWDRVFTATPDGSSTIVRDLVVQPGLGGPELRIPGRWQLPTIGLDAIPAGRSLDGSTVALVEGRYDASAATSRFAIVEHHLLGTVSTVADTPLRLVRVIELAGAFEYDTLSPDGRILYVIEHLDAKAGGRYQVRAVDVSTGVIRDGVIVDKTNVGETMAGAPVAQVRRPDGLVLTLYRGPDHPFIHALASKDAWAVCIDLQGDAGDAAAGLDWGLTPSADGASVFAVNATLGTATEIDPAGLAIRRSASIGQSAAAPIGLAKFGHLDVGPVGRRLVASPDGARLFAAGAAGITVIGTRDLATERHHLAGTAVDGLGISPDGGLLFALLRDGTIAILDPATGSDLGTVPGDSYDRLLAVAPW